MNQEGWLAARWRLASAWAVAVALAVPGGLVAASAAGVVVGILAAPVALIATHDPYLAALAPSYGLAAMGPALGMMMAAAAGFSAALALLAGGVAAWRRRTPNGVAAGGVAAVLPLGALAGLAGVLLGAAFFLPVPPRWLAGTGWLALVAFGALAGAIGAVVRLAPAPDHALPWPRALWRAVVADFCFAGCLAVALATLGALTLAICPP